MSDIVDGLRRFAYGSDHAPEDLITDAADEIERLRAEVERARATGEYWKSEHLQGNVRIGELHDEANELRAEVERLNADAARYRWLRTFEVDSYMARGSLDRLDAEIDAAMAQEQKR